MGKVKRLFNEKLLITSTPLDAQKSNFLSILENYDRQTNQPKQTNIRIHREVTLPLTFMYNLEKQEISLNIALENQGGGQVWMLVRVMQREEESVRIFLLADEPWCPRPSANRFILTLHKRNHCVVARVRLQFKHKKLQKQNSQKQFFGYFKGF